MEQIQQNTQDEYFKYRLKDESGYFTVYLQNNKVFLNFFEGSSLRYIYYEIGSDKIKINDLEQDFGHCNTLMDFLQTLAKKTESKEISLGGEKSITQIKELYDYYCDTHKKDDEVQTNIVQNTTNNQEHQVEELNIEESGKEDNQEVNNSNLDVNRIKKEGNAYQITFGDNNSSRDLNDKNINGVKDDQINIIGSNDNMYNSFNAIPMQEKSKTIHAEIKIKDDKVVVSFYEPLKKMLWIREKDVNLNSVRKSPKKQSKNKYNHVNIEDYLATIENDKKEEQQKEHDEHKSMIIGNNKKEEERKEHYVCKRDNKKKVKEVELDINLLSQEGKGMELKVGKISTFDLVKSETFKDGYEYKITECKEKTKDYDYLLKDDRTLDIGSDKDIKILNFLFSSCEEKMHDNIHKDNNIDDTDASRQQRDEDVALYDALVKAIAKCFSFKENINEVKTNKYLSIELPYNKGQFLITINPAKKEMTYNNQTCQYTDDKTMRQFIKENLYRECLNDNFEEYMKTIWNEKIDKFVDDLDLSQILMKEAKNNDVIDSLAKSPYVSRCNICNICALFK